MGSLDYLDYYGGVAGDAWDLVKGAATGFPNAADVAKPAPVAATPAGATADPNTWPDDWWPDPANAETWPNDWWPQAPAPAPGGFARCDGSADWICSAGRWIRVWARCRWGIGWIRPDGWSRGGSVPG